jgi:hypothetical protein
LFEDVAISRVISTPIYDLLMLGDKLEEGEEVIILSDGGKKVNCK